MRKRMLKNAKLVVRVVSDKKVIRTDFVWDNRTQSYWSQEQIRERGIISFLDMRDMKETLNWNLSGDSSKFQFGWGQTINGISEGYAYIFD